MTIPPTRILITGAAGMIGSAVAKRLAADGHDLVLLDARTPVETSPGRLVVCDARERAAVDDALHGVELVCHIGEIPNVKNKYGVPADAVRETNVAICKTMLDASVAAGVRRFIYTSSCQVYGYWGGHFPVEHLPTVWPIDERQPTLPLNEYAHSKAINETQCARISRASGMQTIRFRFPWVVGPSTVKPARARWNRADTTLDEGFWTYLDVRDAADAYARALAAPNPFPQDESASTAFHFVADGAWGPAPIREKLEKFLPSFPRLPDGWPAHQPPVSCEKAAAYLGWTPRHRLQFQ